MRRTKPRECFTKCIITNAQFHVSCCAVCKLLYIVIDLTCYRGGELLNAHCLIDPQVISSNGRVITGTRLTRSST
jgi:hypothetical protein